MGRGPTVAGQKEASAKAKGKIYSLHSKLISLAAERGADPSLNTSLTDAIHAAKKDGVTADVIDRAIKRGAGLDKDAKKVEEIIYEGYGPAGVAIIVRALTDNRNRTAPSIRHIFSTGGGNLGETGSVSSFLFDYLGTITLETKEEDKEMLEICILDSGATDYELLDEKAEIITDRAHLHEVQAKFLDQGYAILGSSMEYRPKNTIHITDFETALKLYTILDGFDEDEDVEMVWNNADITPELWRQVQEFVESKKFRT